MFERPNANTVLCNLESLILKINRNRPDLSFRDSLRKPFRLPASIRKLRTEDFAILLGRFHVHYRNRTKASILKKTSPTAEKLLVPTFIRSFRSSRARHLRARSVKERRRKVFLRCHCRCSLTLSTGRLTQAGTSTERTHITSYTLHFHCGRVCSSM